MNIYSQVLSVISRYYTPNDIPYIVNELTAIRCREASKVFYTGGSDGRLVRYLNDMIEGLENTKKAYDMKRPMMYNREVQVLMERDDRLRKYCKRNINK